MKTQNIYITRHGVRASQLPDWAEPCNEGPHDGPGYDAPLAAMGRQQAEALAEYMTETPIDFIFSSPFLRTLQTAQPLARAKGIPIQVEWGIAELLKDSWFGAFPQLPSPAERKRDIPEINAEYQSAAMPNYPETREQMEERVVQALSHITENYGPNIFLVGHGASTRGIQSVLLEDGELMGLEFCTLCHITRENGPWRMACDVEAEHLITRKIHVPHRKTFSATG